MTVLDILRNKMIETVWECIDKTKEAYDLYSKASYNQKLQTLSFGEAVPKAGVFYDEDNKASYNNAIKAYRGKAMEAVKKYTDELKATATKEPSAEALRAVQMFMLIDPGTITSLEFRTRCDDMVSRYDDMLSYEAIRAFARKNGYIIAPHPETMLREGAAAVEHSVGKYFDSCIVYSTKYENNNVSDGARAFAKMAINNLASGRKVLDNGPTGANAEE